MRFGSTRMFAGAAATAVVCLLSGAVLLGQAAPAQAPLTSDTAFKNVTMLKGLSVDNFFEAMGMFANAMGNDCTFCHDKQAYFDKSLFATQTPRMMRARQMMVMMNTINKTYFNGETRVTCFTCHQGNEQPKRVPNLALQYGEPIEDANSMELIPNDTFTAEEAFTKYIAAVGGADRIAKVTSFAGKGSYSGFDTALSEIPVEIYSQAPAKMTLIVKTFAGDSIRATDGQNAWMAGPDTPVPLVTLTEGNLARAKLEAMLWYPTPIRTAFPEWKVGLAILGDIDARVVQGLVKGVPQANFYFDGTSGLLVRVVTWTRTPVGIIPTQIDLEDYREVAGVKVPFRRTVSQTYMQMKVNFKEIQANVSIPASRFAQPAPGAGAIRSTASQARP